MPTYVFHLHDGPSVPPREESVEATDLEQARDLAEMRLLLSSQFTHIEVLQDGEELLRLKRDGRTGS
ncbi:hypothetical protein [Brevundimonas sp. Root1423]|uniref:hypothetical protein n=1 Tax=Brevundimonas sp. Root1423 TaxID=1736462 RepID=UPI0006FE430A|nr:hypothetical protein [Brevundimonas sp. Root1423]KQY96564.1 hypothetical protein ASD25_01480 [Brevundimonas sp. Root1423]